MTRTGSVNYTAAGTDFEIADADTDQFDAADVQKLAAAVEAHTHADTRGLPVQRFHASQAAGDLPYASAAGVIARLAKGTALQALRMNAGATAPEWGLAVGASRIAQTTLTEAAANIDFTSIPATYSTLLIILYGRGDTAATTTVVSFTLNGDGGANYDYQLLSASAAVVSASESFGQTSAAGGTIPAANATASVFTGFQIIIPSYANPSAQKFYITESFSKYGTSTGDMAVGRRGGAWRSNSAITQVTLTPAAGNFAIGTVATLYGLY